MEALTKRKLGFFEFVQLTLTFIKDNFTKVFIPITVLTFIVTTISLIIGVLFVFYIIGQSNGLNYPSDLFNFALNSELENYIRIYNTLTRSSSQILLVFLVLAILNVFGTNVITKFILQNVKGENFRITDSLKFCMSITIPILLTTSLISVPTIILFFLILTMPLALWLIVRWSFFHLIVLDQGKYYLNATSESAKLTHNRWWKTFFYLLGITLITVLFVIIIFVILGLIGGAIILMVNASNINYLDTQTVTSSLMIASYIIWEFIKTFINLLSAVFIIVFQVMVYLNWKNFPADSE